ncbi:MAG: DUF456 domain-containing protein [Bacteroidales bacterium]|jgi:uncharacterized protein YqgC (DUF456 family)|nr:DUF456 domain-containing protein [Bacteroidales bacterium]
MDYFLLVLSILLIITGLLGCVLPVLPGPPFSFLGLLLLHFTKFADFTVTFLIITAVLAIIVTVLDYIVPIWGTKKFGGSKAGQWGATIGMIIGMLFLGPLGLIFGPLVGAIIGELIKGTESRQALRAGFGAFIGFLLGVGLKLAASLYMTYHYVKAFF